MNHNQSKKNKSIRNKGKPFSMCFVDADSLIFRIALKTDITLKLAKEYYDRAIEDIVWNTCSDEVFVALKGKGNFRYEVADDYKQHRSGKPLDDKVAKRRKALNKYAYSQGHHKSDNCEADDVVSIWAQEALDAGDHYVIAHIDKDIDMVEGWHYNFTKETLYYIDAAEGWYKMCKQMLTGDSTDNIHGLRGVGPKTAEKILADVAPEDMVAKVQEVWKDRHPEDWKDKLEVCWNLIYMRRDWDSFKQLTIKDTLTYA